MQIFDGHNDALSRLWGTTTDPVGEFAKPVGHVNTPHARAGGLSGGFFALYSSAEKRAFDFTIFDGGGVALPLAPAMPAAQALEPVIAQAGIAQQLHAAGQIEICTSTAQLGRAFVSDPIACVLHLEGADCIGPEMWELDALHAMGLRSLGPVWSRPNIFGEGVPFSHGTDGDTGGGLTSAGQALVAKCKAMGVMVDTSHLTLKGFWDVAEEDLPLVATHSNACAVALNARNLTDDQLRAIRQTGGMVGLNFASLYLSDDGWTQGQATLTDCLRQLDHLIAVAGEDHVGLGSDFDGAPMPQGMSHAGNLPALLDAMRAAGYGEALIAKLAHENWLDFLSRQLNP